MHGTTIKVKDFISVLRWVHTDSSANPASYSADIVRFPQRYSGPECAATTHFI